MTTLNTPPVDWSELEALLTDPAPPAAPMPAWLAATCAASDVCSLDGYELAELATERDERGTLATIMGLLGALRARHTGDRVTLAAMDALEGYHLPALRDELRGV